MAVQLGIYGAIPCCNSDDSLDGGGIGIEYRIGALAFHPNYPVVFMSVLRRRLQEQLNSIPIPPLVYAVSLQVSRHLLGCIGSYDLANDLHDRHPFSSSVDDSNSNNNRGSSSSSSINYCPSTIKCTPHTGLLTVMFDCILHTPTHPRSATIDPSTSVTSTAVTTASIAMVYGLSPSWTRRLGLSVYSSPLMSHLSVPPEVFLYGEGVLNRRATLQKKEQQHHQPSTSTAAGATAAGATAGVKKRTSSSSSTSSFCTHASSFTVMEAAAPRDGLSNTTGSSPSESATLSDLYPVLLALRVGVDRSQGEQHYLCKHY